jgi:ribonucleoside-diphosphate reductase alpha chain
VLLKNQHTFIGRSRCREPIDLRNDKSRTATSGEFSCATVGAGQRHLPDERSAITHQFCVGGLKGYLTVGMYDDGSPGEIFLRIGKEGSLISGLAESFSILVSLALQHGVPLQTLCGKLKHTRFGPSGWSGNPKLGFAKSVMDYVFRYLEFRFLSNPEPMLGAVTAPPQRLEYSANKMDPGARPHKASALDRPLTCTFCGGLMLPCRSWFECRRCGNEIGY